MPQFAADGVPTIDGCRPAVLRVLADGEERSMRQIVEGVATLLDLGEDVVAQRLDSGQGRLHNRVGWACSSFSHAGLLSKQRRGFYRITEDGRAVDLRNLVVYSEDDMREWPTWRAYQDEIAERKRRTPGPDTPPPAVSPDPDSSPAAVAPIPDDPLQMVSDAVRGLNDAVETDLRRQLQEASPEFFERAVLEVLWAMGYGGGNGQKEHLGKSHDGGIDGVIRQDPLGLQNIYEQAKRYADGNTVGRPEINEFYGALAQRGTDRGVFITSSTFTPAAQEAAQKLAGKIILIDGIRLTSLMLHYGVGVEARQTFTVFEVNREFFDD